MGLQAEPTVERAAPGPSRVATTSLPADMLSQSCRRVALASLVIAAGWAFTIVINTAVMRLYPDQRMGLEAWPMPGLLIAGIGIALALLMGWAARRLGRRPELLLDIGLLFEIATGLLIAVLMQWRPYVVPTRVSWLCVLVVLYPAIAPNTPLKTLLASLATVSMDPLFYGLASLRGVVHDTRPVELSWMFVPNYVSAFLAVVPAVIIRHLGRQVKQARELGSYRLGAVLGSGGMGEVYRAQHRLLVRPAAVKVIRSDLLGEGAIRRVAIERFRREAQAAALLQSPHTIALYDFGATGDGTFYYAMELLDGLSLEQLVERFGPVPAERAVHLARQACESIAEAHARGLIHRDLKPSNLVATRLGLEVDFVKVLDFGLVKFGWHMTGQSTTLTAPQVATGTPAFMAPEAALGERTADHRQDLYSLGCVLYWLLTGHLLFDGDTPLKVMQQHIAEPPVPPSQKSELPIPAELDAAVIACLAKQPDERPRTALELSARLASVPVAEPWTQERARRWWDSHLPGAGAAAADPCDRATLMPQISSQ